MGQHCTILGIPIQTGTGRGGCLMGPDALRTAGLHELISGLGYNVQDLGNLGNPKPVDYVQGLTHLVKLPETVAWIRDIQQAAFELAASDTLPIFIGGDHSMAAGTLTGVAHAAAERDQPQFVLWLDAHPDMNTYDNSVRSSARHTDGLCHGA